MKSLPLLRASLKLRRIRARLPGLRREAEPVLDLSDVRAALDSMLERVTAETAGRAGPMLESYVDTHVAEWLSRGKADHQAVISELGLLATRVTEVRELYRVHHDDQDAVLADLEGAVSHAWQRVTEPDTPYYEPEPRSKRRGENR
jgi:hypothetical protein